MLTYRVKSSCKCDGFFLFLKKPAAFFSLFDSDFRLAVHIANLSPSLPVRAFRLRLH